MTTHDESPIIRTSSRRMAQGIAIIVILSAVGAGILIPSWKQMAHNPPAASLIQPEGPPEGVTGVQTSIGTIEGVLSLNLQKAQVQQQALMPLQLQRVLQERL